MITTGHKFKLRERTKGGCIVTASMDSLGTAGVLARLSLDPGCMLVVDEVLLKTSVPRSGGGGVMSLRAFTWVKIGGATRSEDRGEERCTTERRPRGDSLRGLSLRSSGWNTGDPRRLPKSMDVDCTAEGD